MTSLQLSLTHTISHIYVFMLKELQIIVDKYFNIFYETNILSHFFETYRIQFYK